MSLTVYNRKRKFTETPEPKGKKQTRGKGDLRFVVQMHRATRLHFDFRLEFGGVFKSWAVPKGPSLSPLDQRLAVFVEDHPLEYGSFEGIIPPGNYGAGTVMVWDEGTYLERGSSDRKQSEAAIQKGFEKGHITFVLNGTKLKGEFALIKLKKDASEKAWILVKKRDEYSTYKRDQKLNNTSVKTGRTIEQIAKQAEAAGDIWLPKRQTAKTDVKSKLSSPSVTPSRRKTVRPTKAPSRSKAKHPLQSPPDPMPRRNKPMLATVSKGIVAGPEWLIEPVPEGLRALSEVDGPRVKLYSKSGLPFEKKFPDVVTALKDQPHPMVLDGEIIQQRGRGIYRVFDILFCDGRDLRKHPLRERKQILESSLQIGKHVQLVPPLSSDAIGPLVAKNLDSLYHSGTTKDWLQLAVTKANANNKASHKTNSTLNAKDSRPSPKRTLKPSSIEEPRLTNLNKIYWPNEKITKGDLLDYYRKMAPYILPHLKDRPESLNRHPNGIAAAGFYQKDMTGHIPRWLKTERIFSESTQKSIDYVVCQDERSLLYVVNLGCIELNPWFSRVGHLDTPDFLVIDLDPDNNPFSHVIEIAHEVHDILKSVGAASFCKTSGATGIHIGVPTGARYDFDTVRDFAESVCRVVAKKYPATTSLDRNPNRRRGKIYLDYMQNRRGQTLAAPFCIRPRAGAPVSMPLDWTSLTPRVKPEQFHIKNALSHVQKWGDLWKPVLGTPVSLEKCMRMLQKKYAAD